MGSFPPPVLKMIHFPNSPYDDNPTPLTKVQSLAATALRDEPEIVEEDEFDKMATSPEVKKHNQEKVVAALQDALDVALASGMPANLYDRLRWILYRYADCFRLELGDDPPVKVTPLRVRLKPDARPVKAKLRRYPPLYEAFLEDHVQQLLETGLVKMNPDSRWASAPRVVPTKSTELRMTVDHSAANALTDPLVWPMPDLESDSRWRAVNSTSTRMYSAVSTSCRFTGCRKRFYDYYEVGDGHSHLSAHGC
ncbi:unnamed protein product [Phytophthora fragariaefolia]|uniref:Unnamed protein product n=1 Tax=Phytophthora fragariaefolia TaxID=1490495 RepID=A0A9W6XL67_9STRA|nr:unnamed protein product [Phytophthora fragariaefolia]